MSEYSRTVVSEKSDIVSSYQNWCYNFTDTWSEESVITFFFLVMLNATALISKLPTAVCLFLFSPPHNLSSLIFLFSFMIFTDIVHYLLFGTDFWNKYLHLSFFFSICELEAFLSHYAFTMNSINILLKAYSVENFVQSAIKDINRREPWFLFQKMYNKVRQKVCDKHD